MDTIINQIISIEKKAQEMIEDANKQKVEILSGTQKDCETIKQAMDERRHKRLELLAGNEQELADKKIQIIKDENAKKSEELERRFRQKKDEWINEIYQNIVGR